MDCHSPPLHPDASQQAAKDQHRLARTASLKGLSKLLIGKRGDRLSTKSEMISPVGCSRVTIPTLCPAISEPLSTSPSTTARFSDPAQNSSIWSCASSRNLAAPEPGGHLTLRCRELLRTPVGQRANGNDWQIRIDLHRDHGVPRAGANESSFELRVGDRLRGARKSRAELASRGAHLQIR